MPFLQLIYQGRVSTPFNPETSYFGGKCLSQFRQGKVPVNSLYTWIQYKQPNFGINIDMISFAKLLLITPATLNKADIAKTTLYAEYNHQSKRNYYIINQSFIEKYISHTPEEYAIYTSNSSSTTYTLLTFIHML